MKYVSEASGRIFDTEHECLEYERQEKLKKEKLQNEQHERLQRIKSAHEELQRLVWEYGRDYGLERELCFIPTCNLIDALC